MPTFIAYYLGGFCAGPMVAYIHMQAFPANMSFLEIFGIRPIIMIRSIPDMLASYWTMLESDEKSLSEGLNCTIPPDFRTLRADRKQDFLIDMIAPWYAGYYATWLDYARREADRVCVLNYGDFLKRPAATLESLLAHAGVPRPLPECQTAIDAVWEEAMPIVSRRAWRGRSYQFFSMRHFEKIGNMLNHYPVTVDRRAELMGL
jgi:hypothetical protein